MLTGLLPWRGKNVFVASLSGTLESTFDTTRFNKEPTGLAVNPANNHIFFTDDDKKRVFEVNLGPDGVMNTADDVVTSFSTSAFGNGDPEGAGFGNGTLFLTDGVGK